MVENSEIRILSLVHKLGNGGAEKQADLFSKRSESDLLPADSVNLSMLSDYDRILVWTPISFLHKPALLLHFLLNRDKYIVGFRSSYRILGRLWRIRLVQFFIFLISKRILSNVKSSQLYFPFTLLSQKKFIYVHNFLENRDYELSIDGPIQCVFLGRLEMEKGLIELVEYWPVSHYTLEIFGKGSLQNFCLKEGLKWRGHRKFNFGEHGRQCRPCLIFPSLREEGVPNSVLEALNYGVPVVIRDNRDSSIFPDDIVYKISFSSTEEIIEVLKLIEMEDRTIQQQRMDWASEWRNKSEQDFNALMSVLC